MSREIENIERLIDNKKAQFRDFQIMNIEVREAAEGEPEKLIIRGVPCVFNQETLLFRWDNYMVFEQVDERAFDEADMSDVIFNYNHGGRVFARTRNNSLKLNVNRDKKQLEMETELWDDDEGHRQLYRDIKRGNIDKMSFAFTIRSQERTTEEIKENFMPKFDRNIIEYMDLVINPYNYDANKQSGYLHVMYAKFVNTDPFAKDYQMDEGIQ